jgi:hypothetical protein
VTQKVTFYLVSVDWPLSAPPTHAKHAARVKEEVAPTVEKAVAMEVATTVVVVEVAAVVASLSTKTSTLEVVMVAAAVAVTADTAEAVAVAAMETAPASITVEKDQNVVVQISLDAKVPLSFSAQTLVAAAAD